MLVLKAQQVTMVCQEGQEKRAHQESLEKPQTLTQRSFAQTALQDHRDHLDSQESQEIKDNRDLLGKMEMMDTKARQD